MVTVTLGIHSGHQPLKEEACPESNPLNFVKLKNLQISLAWTVLFPTL